MPKRPNLTDVTSLTNSSAINTLNQNWDALEQAFDNTLSLDGSTPNAMNADLDLNGNALLNVGVIDVDELTLNGQQVTDLATVPEWRGPWVTATSYFKNDLVRSSGSSYICLVDHTSGTFSTDLSNGKWELFAQQGAAGSGTGDMVGANNLSDVADTDAARVTLNAQENSGILTAEAGLSPAANQVSYFTGASTKALTDLNAAGRSFLGGTVEDSFSAGTGGQGQGPIPSSARVVVVTTTTSAPSSVTLPTINAGEVGKQIVIFNRGTRVINVYPSAGTSLQVATPNIPLALAIGFVMRIEQRSSTMWLCSIQPASYDTSGRVLGTNLIDSTVDWVYPSRTLLDTRTASNSSSLDFTTFNNSIFRRYEFEIENLRPTTDDVALLFRTSSNGGSSYDFGGSDYQWAVNGMNGTAATSSGSAAAGSIILTGNTAGARPGNAAGEYGVSGMLTIFNAANGSSATDVQTRISFMNTATAYSHYTGNGVRVAAGEVNACRFVYNGSNTASGTIRMYGIV